MALGLVRSGDYDSVEMLYEDVPDTLSQLIRTAFIPKDGNKLIVSDFSAIEARVITWMAGETWRQEVFEKGSDIYCTSASQMFKVPVEKHGILFSYRSGMLFITLPSGRNLAYVKPKGRNK